MIDNGLFFKLGFIKHILEENLQRDKNLEQKREFSREREKSQMKKRIFSRRDTYSQRKFSFHEFFSKLSLKNVNKHENGRVGTLEVLEL